MANFDLGPSAGAWERPRSRRSLTAHDPSAPVRRTQKQFLPIAHFMANFARAFAVVQGLNMAGRKPIPNRTPRKVILPIAYFMANSGVDLRFTLTCRRAA